MHECKTVTLRTRPLKNKMLSFYLDYYPGYRDKETMKVIRHESLGIYIYANPRNKREQNFNEVMTEKAEAIRCRRFESVVNERYDFFDSENHLLHVHHSRQEQELRHHLNLPFLFDLICLPILSL